MPSFILMKGFTAVGKSTLARKISESLKAPLFSSAIIRRELGLAPDQGNEFEYRLDDPVFVEQISPRTYRALVERGTSAIESGHKSVILDATFNFRWQRDLVYEAAHSVGADVIIVLIEVSDEAEIRRRLEKRALEGSTGYAEISAWDTYVSTRELSDPLSGKEMSRNGVSVYCVDSYKRTVTQKSDSASSTMLTLLREVV